MKMKNLLALLLALCLTLCLCACSAETGEKKDDSTTAATQTGKETNPTEPQKPTEPQTPTNPQPTGVDYVVKVVDESGNPVANAEVQLCNADNCFLPAFTDANGTVTFNKPQGSDYKAKVNQAEGFVADADYTSFNDATEITITLKAAS